MKWRDRKGDQKGDALDLEKWIRASKSLKVSLQSPLNLLFIKLIILGLFWWIENIDLREV